MPRPMTHDDIVGDRTVEFGYVDVEEFASNPAVLKAYSAFLESLNKAGFLTVPNEYVRARTMFQRNKRDQELDSQLHYEQREWDRYERMYDACCVSGTEPENYEKSNLVRWCETEGVALPWATEADSETENVA